MKDQREEAEFILAGLKTIARKSHYEEDLFLKDVLRKINELFKSEVEDGK